MLVIVIFERLGEAHRGQPRLVKRIVIPAAAVAVHAENHANRRAPINLLDRPRQFPRRRIRIIDFAIPGKKPDAMRSTGSGIGAHNIVVQHPADGVALLFRPLQKMRAAKQPLLFPGNSRKQYRRAIRRGAFRRRLAEQAHTFHAHRHSRGIVVRSWSIRLWIHHIRRP